MQISAFFRGRNNLSNVWKYIWTMPQGWCHICLRIRSKFKFFWKFEGHSLCARLRPFSRKIEKIPQQPTVIVDVHVYKIKNFSNNWFHRCTIICQTFMCGAKKASKSGHFVCTISLKCYKYSFNATFYAFV